MNNTVFVCKLSKRQQGKIKTIVSNYCTKEGYSKDETIEMINNVMEDRLCVLEDIGIDTIGFLNKTKVIKLRH